MSVAGARPRSLDKSYIKHHMGESYHYFSLDHASLTGGLPLTEALSVIRRVFEQVREDQNAAVEDAKRRHRALSNLGAPASVVALYADPRVTRIRAADSDSHGYYIEFDLWDKQGIMVYPKPDEARLDICDRLARKLAAALSYRFAVEKCD